VSLEENLPAPFEQKNDEGIEHNGAYPEVERKQFEARLELRGKQYVNFLIVK
jgi:hypothetical protein